MVNLARELGDLVGAPSYVVATWGRAEAEEGPSAARAAPWALGISLAEGSSTGGSSSGGDPVVRIFWIVLTTWELQAQLRYQCWLYCLTKESTGGQTNEVLRARNEHIPSVVWIGK